MRWQETLGSHKAVIIVLAVLMASLAVNVAAMVGYISWMDEAIISDIVYDYFRDPGYVPPSFVYEPANEGRIYGPVFFYIQTALVSALGDDPFVFRLSNLLAFYLVAGVVTLLFHGYTGNKKITPWLAVIMLTSYAINKNSVSGRMDMVATLFALLSLLCALAYRNGSMRALFGSALFASMAFLTTPRALFLLPATLVVLGYCLVDQRARNAAKRDMIIPMTAAAAIFLVPIGCWILAVGGIRAYLELFLNPDMVAFLGTSVFRNWRDWIYLPVLLAVMLMHWRQMLADRLVVACCATFVVFALFVREVGPYRAMIMPYVFLLGALVAGLAHEGTRRSLPAMVLAGVALSVGVPFFAGRALLYFYVERDCRSAWDFRRHVLADMPAHYTFLADYRFYYLLKGHLVTFSPREIYAPDFFLRNDYPDRILLGDDSMKSLVEYDSPLKQVLRDDYEVVTTYSCPFHDLGLGDILQNRKEFYNATLYRRKASAIAQPDVGSGNAL